MTGLTSGAGNALGIAPVEAIVVVLSAVGISVAFLVLLRLFGQRSVARMTTFDVAVLLVLGSVGGRVITGYTPTLTAGLIALLTLMVLRWIADLLGRTRVGAFLVRDRPLLLVAGNEILRDNLRRARLSRPELWGSLRTAGIRDLDEVAAVVMESTGTISILRRGHPLARDAVADIPDHRRIPAAFFSSAERG